MRGLRIATFVIVHGRWGGSWEWSDVSQLLRQRDHRVFTPTLVGLGARVQENAPEVDLETHVQDVVDVLDRHDLHDVVPCGHSYGGIPVTGAADRVPRTLQTCFRVTAPDDWEPTLDWEHDGHRWCDLGEAASTLRWPRTAQALREVLALDTA